MTSSSTKFKTYEAERLKRMEQRVKDNEASWNRTEPFYHWLIDVYFFIVCPWS